ncbi:hypothetical protein BD560DRAFT_441880 [Blakeslea trispora]|nr:hypothetical protein BD560DRAFT_441880 [Blakeslea trispora]
MHPTNWIKNFEANMNALKVDDEDKSRIVAGYLGGANLSQWFEVYDLTDWNHFKRKFTERFQFTKVNVNSILCSLLAFKRLSGESIREYFDRLDHLHAKYEKARITQAGRQKLDPSILKYTFIKGILPKYLEIVIKKLAPGSLHEAQSMAIQECSNVSLIFLL